jgi:hypothetical protein
MTIEFTDEDRRILAYLTERVGRGEEYFRARTIAPRVGLTPKQVGARLPRLAERVDSLVITKWGRHRGTTWRVQPR